MAALQNIRAFFALRRFAVVGVSRDSKDFSRLLFHEFVSRGFEPVPVNPDASEIEGRKCFARLGEIQPPVEGALFMTPPAVTDALVCDCPQAGIQRVWMFRGAGKGAATPQAIQYCESHGIQVIPGECPFMFLPHGAWYHRFHGLIRRIAGSYPG